MALEVWLIGAGAGILFRAADPKVLGFRFRSPFRGAEGGSGWLRPRPHRNGVHRGLDLAAKTGTLYTPAVSGVVVAVHNTDDDNRGRHLVVRSESSVGVIHVRYLHNDKNLAKKGQSVKAGATPLATVGSTGTSSTGPHIHMDVFADDRWLVAYAQRFGTPAKGFPAKRALGTQVPIESLLPVRYSARTIQEAAEHDVAVRGVTV